MRWRVEVEAAYLYGAPAAGNRFTGKLVLTVPEAPVPGTARVIGSGIWVESTQG